MKMLVLIESPYAGDVAANIAYAKACMRDSFERGELPFASHLLYTRGGILDDTKKEERRLGIEAGLEWGRSANLTAVYTDRGISAGMIQGIHDAQNMGRTIEFRQLKTL